MDFLKEALNEKFTEFADLIDAYNRQYPEKAVKLANLSGGGYVDKDKYSSLKAKYEKEMGRLKEENQISKKEFALELALREEKPKNLKAVKALLDFDSIIYEDGELIGFKEQMEAVKKENGFLFEGKMPHFARPVTGGGEELTREDFKKLSYMEKLKLKKESPELYTKLK
ncbi:MAG: hypothetical protein E7407_03785 [Ruminococcaceae bacterium]|nr:hypothetical protein [Oscillospiraceae bacterium]